MMPQSIDVAQRTLDGAIGHDVDLPEATFDIVAAAHQSRSDTLLGRLSLTASDAPIDRAAPRIR